MLKKCPKQIDVAEVPFVVGMASCLQPIVDVCGFCLRRLMSPVADRGLCHEWGRGHFDRKVPT